MIFTLQVLEMLVLSPASQEECAIEVDNTLSACMSTVLQSYWWLPVQEAGDALMGMTAAQMHELVQQEEQAGMGEEESLAEQARRRALFRPWLMRLRISQQTYRDDISIRKTISRWR